MISRAEAGSMSLLARGPVKRVTRLLKLAGSELLVELGEW